MLSSPALGSPTSPKKSLKRSRKEVETEKMEHMKLRSMLSRMGGVVDTIWSLYNLSPRRKIILESEVTEVITKSSKVALSHGTFDLLDDRRRLLIFEHR